MRKIVLFFFTVAGFLSLPKGFYWITQGFKPSKIAISIPYREEWETKIDLKTQDILKQRFFYLDKGVQSYVFVSQDGQYVIKFFRSDLPEEKIVALLSACKMAYEQLKEETALLYVHLNHDSETLPRLECVDPIGRLRKLSLNQYRFAIQRKANSFREIFEKPSVHPKEIEKRISQLLALVESRAAKGVVNKDLVLSRNFGFLEDRAIEIDFGQYESGDSSHEVEKTLARVRSWLMKQVSKKEF